MYPAVARQWPGVILAMPRVRIDHDLCPYSPSVRICPVPFGHKLATGTMTLARPLSARE